MNTVKELLNHLLFEFSDVLPGKNRRMLTEKRGRITDIDKIVDYLCVGIQKQALNVIKDRGRSTLYNREEYTGNIKDAGINTFFDEYYITVDIYYQKRNDEYSGGFYPGRSFTNISDPDTGEFIGVKCSPNISIMVNGTTLDEIMHTIRFALGHELTHAYNSYQYANKTHSTVDQTFNNFSEGQRYKYIQKASRKYSGNPKAVANLLYHLNRMERNSYIAQLYNELLDRKDEIKDVESAARVIKETESYRKFKNVRANIEAIYSPTITDDAKNNIMLVTNEITGKNFTTYNQVKKYYLRVWDKWKKKYLSTASKIARDIYEDNNPEIIDPLGDVSTLIDTDFDY